MWIKILATAITALFQILDEKMIREFIDAGLDAVEDYAANTPNEIDDAILIPACKLVRTITNTPDND